MSSRVDIRHALPVQIRPAVPAKRTRRAEAPCPAPRWVPWIFAAKTTVAALLALLAAFTFDLDAPKWSLLTVFIVAQPQSGLVLAKGFYRILGTFAGAAVALVLVSLFAQERVLFLATLALWILICTFVARSARNFASYGLVLSGYTAAIVGITGALDPDNAFFVAQARVTEISLGIIAAATVSQLVFPLPLAATLRRAVATARTAIGDCATAALQGQDTTEHRNRVVAQAVAIETLRASAVFEDPDVRARSDDVRSFAAAMLGVADIAYLLSHSMERLRGDRTIRSELDPALKQSAEAVGQWHRSELDAPELQRDLTRAAATLPLARKYHRELSAPDEEVIHRTVVIGRLREFFAALGAFAGADEAMLVPASRRKRPAPLYVANDWFGDAVAGLRAALALLVVGTFWILADWPSGPTATILTVLATARLATMEQPLHAAIGGTMVIVLATLPGFVIAEVLLPQASGFAMFSLAVAPVLFLCAFLMAHKKTAGLGFIAILYFASTAAFQDRMAYDPVGFLNDSIAIAMAIATAALLFATVAPETPAAAQRRFVRVARRIFRRIDRPARPIRLTEFETAMTGALDRWRRDLAADGTGLPASFEAGVALLGIGRELIRVGYGGTRPAGEREVAHQVAEFLDTGRRPALKRGRHAAAEAAVARLRDLRADELGPLEARAASREMVAFAAIRDELERCDGLLWSTSTRERRHAA